jgi:hypothetical protein
MHQLMVCVDVNSLSKNKNTIKRNTAALLDAGREVGVNTEKTKYMVMSHHQNAG